MLNRTQVAADKYRRNPTYGIRMGTQIKFLAHDPNNICHPGAPPSVSTPSLFHHLWPGVLMCVCAVVIISLWREWLRCRILCHVAVSTPFRSWQSLILPPGDRVLVVPSRPYSKQKAHEIKTIIKKDPGAPPHHSRTLVCV